MMGPRLYRVAALMLLGTLSKGQLPEDDFRIVNRQDLLASDSDMFEDNSTKSFSQLLFDVARDQLIVGARDTLYRLSLRGLRPLERADWPAPANKSHLCQDKGQTEDDCHNYVKVLLSYGHKLFACGTNAFSPECSWREIESINTVTEWVSGVANCPYNPHSNVTTILSSSGEFYAATPTDFASSQTSIYRTRGASAHNSGTLRTREYDLTWLNQPEFVGSFEDDFYVYFVFREYAVEFMNCGKAVYSRIARVCKNDSGSQLRRDNWSTFLKARLACPVPGDARLACPVPGDVPFHYDEVQGVEYLPQEKLLVATFTTPRNGIAGSAVCIYNMSDIDAAFEGPFKVQNTPTSSWEHRSPSTWAREHFRCVQNPRNQQSLEYHNYMLMHYPIQPISDEPVYRVTSDRFTHVTVDVATSKSVGKQLVLFVATQDSDVLKLAVLPRYEGACLVERWRLRDGRGFAVLSMQFVKDTMSLYIGNDNGVLRIGSERCSRHARRSGCVGAADPHCGWDDARDACVRTTTHLHDAYFVQNTASCPEKTAPVDGGWSSWSQWEPCMQDGTSHSVYGDEKPDMCMCRTRKCDNPKPVNGGRTCEGASISVTNCTVHGGWSAWSGWSECSASCGIAVKSRRRACTAPEPKHGGRVCVGQDTNDLYCNNLPPCPDPALAPVDGGWSAWGPWSACTAAGGPGCGPSAGWKERKRTCTNPEPKYGGADCEGGKVDRQVCDMRPCEIRKGTAWTPWVQIPGNASDGSYTEKRFKFSCKAPSPEQVKLTLAREEERYCDPLGLCVSADDAGWEPWGAWGACSAPCGGGQQARRRRCRRPPCAGAPDMLRACNVHACSGEWSCWSEWSPCTSSDGSAGCGSAGRRSRTRTCRSREGCADAGAALETRVCVLPCAESEGNWSAWGEWSECENNERTRRRSCDSGACAGTMLQVAPCDSDDMSNELYALPAYSDSVEMASFVRAGDSLSVGGIVGCVVAAFVMGCLACLAGVIYIQRRGTRLPWRRSTRVPSSPHYITAKQNSYVTVPLKDVPRKAKRQPSFTGIGNSSGILLSKSNNISNANNHNNTATTPKLYPKAIANEYDSMGTLRRHSNQPNNRNNLDSEEDKFY
ncbi:semaphorin-5B [Cydia fagiglandana]|uniref:semaphorin-5B n=1 Tax=Cydia fagiglandana TaxID=1458189 RepID=UPI002FEE22C1